jgi:hypothetical protein
MHIVRQAWLSHPRLSQGVGVACHLLPGLANACIVRIVDEKLIATMPTGKSRPRRLSVCSKTYTDELLRPMVMANVNHLPSANTCSGQTSLPLPSSES